MSDVTENVNKMYDCIDEIENLTDVTFASKKPGPADVIYDACNIMRQAVTVCTQESQIE